MAAGAPNRAGIGTAARNTPGPPSILVFSAMVDSTNVTARVRRAKSSPRTPYTRKTTAATATPKIAATRPATGSVQRNGMPALVVSVAVV